MLNYEFKEFPSKKITLDTIKNLNLTGTVVRDENFINYNLIGLSWLSKTEIERLEKLFSMTKNPFLKQRLDIKHFESILIEIDQCFFKNWELFQLKMSEFSPAKKNIHHFKEKQKYIQECSLMSFLKDVIGLLNRIDIELFSASLLSLHIEQMQKHLTLIDNWAQTLEDADLDNNKIHNLLLSFCLKINMLASESHLKLAIPYWLEKNDDNLSTFHFDKGAELICLSEQNIHTLKSVYKHLSLEYEIACFSFRVWKSTHDSQFIQGKNYVKKLINALNQSKVIISSFVEPIIIYAEHLSLSENRDLQEVLYYLGQAIKLLMSKEIYTEEMPTNRYQAFIAETKMFCEKMKQSYRNEMILLLEQYAFFKSYKDDRLLLSINAQVHIKKIEAHFSCFPGVVFCKNKKNIEISRISLIPTPDLKNILFQINQLLYAKPETKVFAKEILIKKEECSFVGLESEGVFQSTNIEMPSLSVTTLNESVQPVSRQPFITVEEILSPPEIGTIEKKEEVVDNLAANLSHKFSLIESNECTSYGFTNPLFNEACIKPLEGAKGIFVAYDPKNGLSSRKCKKIDPQLELRFQNLLDYPNKVNPKNKNGFKWVAHGDSAVLVGKIKRLPYRLFPQAKEINSRGETAYFYGDIRNTKRGKRGNQY